MTLELIVMAGVICVLITVPLALWAAIRKDRAADQVIRIIPVRRRRPAGALGRADADHRVRRRTCTGSRSAAPVPGRGSPSAGWSCPAFTAAIAISPVLIRSLRAGMLEVLESDYIAAARAKSLSESRVLLAHVARNAAVPT